MTPEQFCYWLQGRAELDETPPTAEQWKSIREHLATVFVKVTPPLKPASPIFPDKPPKDFSPIKYPPIWPEQPKWPDPYPNWQPPTITCTTTADPIFVC